MADRLALARKIMQARNKGIPSLVANFSGLMTASIDSLTPLLLIATGDVMEFGRIEDINAWTTWAARPLLAEAVANRWAQVSGVRDAENTMQDRDRSRFRLGEMLLQHPSNINDIRSLVADIERQVRTASAALLPHIDTVNVVPSCELVSDQTFKFYQLRGHMIPAILFQNQDAQVAWTSLSNTRTHWVNIEDIDFVIVADLNHRWPQIAVVSVLGYYEGKAQQNMDKVRGFIAGAVFTYIATLAKNINMTPAWVQRRKAQFQAMLPDVPLDAYVHESVCTHYARMYRKNDESWEDVYRQLVVCWFQLQVPEGLSLTWTIEQAANNNVTCLTTIADMITKLRFFNDDLLLSKGLPRGNFTEALTQALDLIRNPFISLTRPTIQVRKYADLAYLCMYIKKELLKDPAFGGYRGQVNTMCILPEVHLKLLATKVFNITQELINAEMEISDIYRAQCQASNEELVETAGQFFVFTRDDRGF